VKAVREPNGKEMEREEEAFEHGLGEELSSESKTITEPNSPYSFSFFTMNNLRNP
jgi:hypothetical protein